MSKNIIFQLIKFLASITSIVDGTYLSGAATASKPPKPIRWFDGKSHFEAKAIKYRCGKKTMYKLEITREGKPSRMSAVINSRDQIINELQRYKDEVIYGIEGCEAVIQRAEKFKYCYFWDRDNGNQNTRNYYAKQWSVPERNWNDGENDWSVSYSVTQSRKNTYASGEYRKNGKTTNLNAVRHQLILLQELKSMINEALGQPEDN